MLPDQLFEWNRTEFDYPRNSTIAEVFKQQVAMTPDAIAVVSKDRQLTYRELDERSNRVARRLRSLGVRPETLVGISIGRSETLVISLLAILKAGGAYIPLDPGHPKERLALVIEDSQMAMLIASEETRAGLPSGLSHIAMLDIDEASIGEKSTDSLTPTAVGSNLAYVMYTSGSTGSPKGVMVEHRNVLNFFAGMDRVLGREPGTWLAVTGFSFDISVLELLWTLTRGFTVVVHGDDGIGTIGEEIIRHGVTHLQMTPSLARMLTLDARTFSALSSLKQILLGGEAVPASLILRLRHVFNGELYNMYGPTETTIWSSTYKVGEPGSTVPIGRPIANTQIFILDSELNSIHRGEAGELFIGGDGVARGYLNRPELTADRFLILPWFSNQRVYRTGDIGRILPDGNIEFLGRADSQIKLRGHRIELGEIEAALEQCQGVIQAVIVVREDREGDQRLVAYLVAESGGPETASAFKNALSLRLPETMVPSAFVFVSELPLTANGKIDRNALLRFPPPGFQATWAEVSTGTEPASEIEQIVARVWKEALGVPEVGLSDNFFDLGAHSLTVAEVQAKLQNALGRNISIVDLFQFSTVSSLSGHLAGTQSHSQISDRAERRRLARQR